VAFGETQCGKVSRRGKTPDEKAELDLEEQTSPSPSLESDGVGGTDDERWC
jgi:hypothetical protein